MIWAPPARRATVSTCLLLSSTQSPVSTAKMQAIRAQVVVPQASQAAKTQRAAAPVSVVPRIAKAMGAGLAALTLAASAHAATVKLGADSGEPL